MRAITILISIIMLAGISANGQQNVVFPMGENSKAPKEQTEVASKTQLTEAPIPEELSGAQFFEHFKLPFPVTLYGNDQNALRKEAKQKVIDAVFSDYCSEHSNLVCYMLRYHAGALVKVPELDNIAETSGSERKKGTYKFNVEDVLVNKTLINYIANNADKLFSLNTVVLYRPDSTFDASTIKMYEDARTILQSGVKNFENKMTSLKNIDVMPICNVPKGKDTLNYYRELLECVKREKRISADVAIVIKDINIQNIVAQPNGYEALVDVSIDIFNANTYSFILTKKYQSTGNNANKKDAVKNAIENIMFLYIKDMLIQMTGEYYTYIMDGKETIIELNSDCYNDNTLDELLGALEKSKYLKISNINISADKAEIKCFSYKIPQFDVYRLINSLKPKSIECGLFSEGNALIFRNTKSTVKPVNPIHTTKPVNTEVTPRPENIEKPAGNAGTTDPGLGSSSRK